MAVHEQVRKMLADGWSKVDIADELGISRQSVYRIIAQITKAAGAALVGSAITQAPTKAQAERLVSKRRWLDAQKPLQVQAS